jgi:hypothetical protein
MPAATAKAPFSFLTAVKTHAKDQTNYGIDFGKLPAPISNGRARVITAAIGEYKTGDKVGKKFVRLAATVLSPLTASDVLKSWKPGGPAGKGIIEEFHREIRDVQGLQTSVMYPLCDDKRGTAEENVGYMLNELRRTMGDENFTAPLAECKTEEQSFKVLEALLKRVAEAKPVIKFSTSRPDPNKEYPKQGDFIFENWLGKAEELPVTALGAVPVHANGHAAPALANGSAVGGVRDATQAATQAASQAPAAVAGEAPAAADGFNETAGDLPADDDWDGWVAKFEEAEAAGDDATVNDAIDKLTAIAVAAGCEKEAVENAENWAAVKELMDAAGSDATTSEAVAEPAAEDAVPSKNDIVFAVISKDPKNPKKGKAKTELTVETVNQKNKTVTAKNNLTKKLVTDKDGKALAIPFADLLAE